MIDATGLTKVFGDKVAVDNLSFSVRSGMVTGFLGPNGAGKSTTMRLILGLDHPTKGHCRVNGRSYRYTKAPMTEVGALLEAKSVHPGRTARSHLKALAATHGIPTKRVDEVIELVGLSAVATKRAGDFSLGMGQRLGLAAALLGDPETLILDEPINGLDPEGVAWVRSLLKYLAEEGRTVFISSHLMSEMAMVADHIIIIGRGRLISDSPMSDLIERASGRVIKVRSPQVAQIREVVARSGRTITDTMDGAILISGLSPEAIGKEAARRGWVLYELTPVQRSLEDIYMELTDSVQEFRTEGRFNELAASQHPPVGSPPDEEKLTEDFEDDEEVPDDEDEYPAYEPAPSDTIDRAASPARPVSSGERLRTGDPELRTRTTNNALRSRPSGVDSLSRSRPSGVNPTPRPPSPDSSSQVRSRPRSPEPPPRPRTYDSELFVRPRLPDDPLPRTRSLDSEPNPKPRSPDDAPRSQEMNPVPRPRFMDADYPAHPRPSDPELFRSRLMEPEPAQPAPRKPDERRSETSADPLRLPRPQTDQLPEKSRPGTPGQPGSSDPNRPRRAWGV